MARAVAASSSAVRGRSVARSRFWNRIAILALAAGVLAVGVPLFFAGSADRLADGTRIAGRRRRRAEPEGRPDAARAAFGAACQRAGHVRRGRTRSFPITPRSMGVEVDWRAAVAAACPAGRRLRASCAATAGSSSSCSRRIVAPPTRSYGAALDYELGLLGKAVDTPHREAALVRRGLHITIAPGKTGRVLDRAAARTVLVHSLASFSRAPVALPVRLDAAAGDRRLADRGPAARLADHLRAGDRSSPGRRVCASHAGGSRSCSTSTRCASSGLRPTRTSPVSSTASTGPAKDASFAIERRQDQRRPVRSPVSPSTSRAPWRPCSRQPSGR